MKHPNLLVVEAMLARFGGLYVVADIIEEVKAGRMQSFAWEDSWMVTQIAEFPQKKVLNIVLAVGNQEGLDILEAEVTGFAKVHGCALMTTDARKGFVKRLHSGWKHVSATYAKDLSDGS